MNIMLQNEEAISLMRTSQNIVAFSGAGISTEAGIPDFRSPGGIWNDAEMVERLSLSYFHRDPGGFYQASRGLVSAMRQAQPTLAHRLLVRLEEIGKLQAVATQNIDGLHHAAGSRTVHELHGTYRTGHCTQCRQSYDMAAFYEDIESGLLRVPCCCACRAPIKPDIVLFEEMLPVDAWESSVRAAEECDLMLVFGSSLVVYPAAELPVIAVSCGARLVIVNLDPTDYDHMATVALHCRLGDFAQLALAALVE